MKKLYNGTATVNIVVYAEDEKEARQLIKDNAQYEMDNGFVIDVENEIKSDMDLNYGWDGGCLVYHSGKEDICIGDILNAVE